MVQKGRRLLLLAVNHDNDLTTALCAQITCGQKMGDSLSSEFPFLLASVQFYRQDPPRWNLVLHPSSTTLSSLLFAQHHFLLCPQRLPASIRIFTFLFFQAGNSHLGWSEHLLGSSRKGRRLQQMLCVCRV